MPLYHYLDDPLTSQIRGGAYTPGDRVFVRADIAVTGPQTLRRVATEGVGPTVFRERSQMQLHHIHMGRNAMQKGGGSKGEQGWENGF